MVQQLHNSVCLLIRVCLHVGQRPRNPLIAVIDGFVDGDTVLWESNAILCYLAGKGDTDLWPKSAKRYDILRWMFWESNHLTNALNRLFGQKFFSRDNPDQAIVERASKDFRKYAEVLDANLANNAYVTGDTQTKSDAARASAKRMIEKDGAIMITGGSSSGVAVAVQGLCQEMGVIFMAGLTHSNDTTGKDKRRYGFRHFFNGYMSGAALAPVLKNLYGDDRKAYHLTADYTWGWTQQESIAAATEALGWETVENVLTPLASTDFSSYIAPVLNSGADILVLNHYGGNMVNSLTNAVQFGLRDTVEECGSSDSARVEDGRHDVDHGRELRQAEHAHAGSPCCRKGSSQTRRLSRAPSSVSRAALRASAAVRASARSVSKRCSA